MGQQQSKDELLYQQVSYGNIEGIKSLHRDGAGLEWIDRDAKTPLIVASMNPEFHNVVKTLIELGANVNAYRPGRHAGTPLHHAAKRGLQNTVKLLLLHGANALVMNDDCQTPLDVAREKGHTNVVRAIESHICLFSGWMREFYGLGFLETWAPQFVSKKVWVVILPSGSRNPTKPFKLELAMYPGVQDAQPRAVIALWKANLEEPKSTHSDTSVTILENVTIPRGRRQRRRYRRRMPSQTRIKLAPEKENDRQQLQQFCNACKGIPQTHPAFLHDHQTPILSATAPPDSAEDLELAMAISASLQSARQESQPLLTVNTNSEASTSSTKTSAQPSTSGGTSSAVLNQVQHEPNVPIAPPLELTEEGEIHYPSIDSSPIELPSVAVDEKEPAKAPAEVPEKVQGDEIIKKGEGDSSSCVICLDASVEGACIPCGHMAGCMMCLNEIAAKKWGCPVCRAHIDLVVKLYTV